jgi:hypothetical protein
VKRAALAVLAVLASACGPELVLVTPAPPNRVAGLNQDQKTVEVSEGVAVAIECRREGGPCKEVTATTADPKVARVFPAHISQVDRGWIEQGNISSLALVGVSPGKTTVHVVASGSATDYTVTVLPAPAAPKRAVP